MQRAEESLQYGKERKLLFVQGVSTFSVDSTSENKKENVIQTHAEKFFVEKL